MKKLNIFASLFIIAAVSLATVSVFAEEDGGGSEHGSERAYIAQTQNNTQQTQTQVQVQPQQIQFQQQIERKNDKSVEKMEIESSDFFEHAKGLNVKESAPESVNIGPNGQVKITSGNLDAIASSTLTVSAWGIKFSVDATQAKITGPSQNVTLADLKVGDEIFVNGVIDAKTGIVKATLIHDRSLQSQAVSSIEARIQQLLQMIQQLQAQIQAAKNQNTTPAPATTTTTTTTPATTTTTSTSTPATTATSTTTAAH